MMILSSALSLLSRWLWTVCTVVVFLVPQLFHTSTCTLNESTVLLFFTLREPLLSRWLISLMIPWFAFFLTSLLFSLWDYGHSPSLWSALHCYCLPPVDILNTTPWPFSLDSTFPILLVSMSEFYYSGNIYLHVFRTVDIVCSLHFSSWRKVSPPFFPYYRFTNFLSLL